MHNKFIYQGIASVLIGASLVSCGKGGFVLEPVTNFKVESVTGQNVTLNTSYPATIKGKQDIEIRPQVSGFITKLCVDEGALVKKGEVLFVIDPVQYEAQVNSAKAAVESAQAALETQRLTAKNKAELYSKNIISEYEKDMAANALKSAEAQLEQAKAALVSAQKNLSYTNVTSPSDGVVGSIPYRVGSLVSPSVQTPLTVISEFSEVYAYFSITEKDLLEYSREFGSAKNILSGMPAVQLQLSDGTVYDLKGKVETLSGVVDQSTGSVTARALFKNPNRLLRSGATGNVLIPHTINNAVVIPQNATYEIQDKHYVYVLQPDSTVANTEIGVYNINDGETYIVTEGLKIGEEIAVEGITLLKDKMKITPVREGAETAEGEQEDNSK